MIYPSVGAAPEALGLIHKHKAHGQEERAPPPHGEPRCCVDLITHALAASSQARRYFLL